jgi:hypothetical protein
MQAVGAGGLLDIGDIRLANKDLPLTGIIVMPRCHIVGYPGRAMT